MFRSILILCLSFGAGCKTIQNAYEAFREASSAVEAIQECRGGKASTCMKLQTKVLEQTVKGLKIRAVAFSESDALRWAEERAAFEMDNVSVTLESKDCQKKQSVRTKDEESNRQTRGPKDESDTYWSCVVQFRL